MVLEVGEVGFVGIPIKAKVLEDQHRWKRELHRAGDCLHNNLTHAAISRRVFSFCVFYHVGLVPLARVAGFLLDAVGVLPALAAEQSLRRAREPRQQKPHVGDDLLRARDAVVRQDIGHVVHCSFKIIYTS